MSTIFQTIRRYITRLYTLLQQVDLSKLQDKPGIYTILKFFQTWLFPRTPRVNDLVALPGTQSKLFGRESELEQLNTAWADPNTRVLVLEAFGGMGKTALLPTLVDRLCQSPCCRLGVYMVVLFARQCRG